MKAVPQAHKAKVGQASAAVQVVKAVNAVHSHPAYHQNLHHSRPDHQAVQVNLQACTVYQALHLHSLHGLALCQAKVAAAQSHVPHPLPKVLQVAVHLISPSHPVYIAAVYLKVSHLAVLQAVAHLKYLLHQAPRVLVYQALKIPIVLQAVYALAN